MEGEAVNDVNAPCGSYGVSAPTNKPLSKNPITLTARHHDCRRRAPPKLRGVDPGL